MNKFSDKSAGLIRKLVDGSSLTLAVVYTVGHIIIAMTCNRIITGADWGLASMDAVIEPCINGLWFYALHTIWRRCANNTGTT